VLRPLVLAPYRALLPACSVCFPDRSNCVARPGEFFLQI